MDLFRPFKQLLELLTRFALPLAGAVVCWFFAEHTLPHELDFRFSSDKSVLVIDEELRGDMRLVLTVVWFLLSTAVLEIARVSTSLNAMVLRLKVVEGRFAGLLEHTAFFTENNKMESALGLLRSTQGRRTWIVAKFISKKLSKSFDLRIDVDGPEYSAFAEKLYPECEDAIFITMPTTPGEWFKQLLTPADVSSVAAGSLVPKPPPHVRELLSATAPVKRRLVVLDDSQWVELHCVHSGFGHDARCAEKRNFLKAFLDINKGIDTRFVKRETLKAILGLDYNSRVDYAIFDRQLVLKWERPSDNSMKMALHLLPHLPTDEAAVLDLFDFDRHVNYYKKGNTLLKDLGG
jgi:hypothetical protein